jgi:hypothetical protein
MPERHDSSTSPADARSRRRAVIVAVAGLTVAVGLFAALAVVDTGLRTPSSGAAPLIVSSTLSGPPGTLQGANEVIDGPEKSEFTSQLSPTEVVESYLEDFTSIGWTTLSSGGDGARVVLRMKGDNRYATVVAAGVGRFSRGVVCHGADQGAVEACAGGGAGLEGPEQEF